MKEIYRSGAWEIVLGEKAIFSNYENGFIKIWNRKTLEIEKAVKFTRDYYDCLCVDEEEGILILLGVTKNSIDILDMDTLEERQTVKWKGKRTYIREDLVYNKKEKTIYCILYSETKQHSLVTKLFIRSMEETVVWEKQGFYADGFLYDRFHDEYIVLGGRFRYPPNDREIASFEEGIWLNQSQRTVSFVGANKHGGKYLQSVGFLFDGRLIYAVERRNADIYYLGEKKPIVKKIERAAFSKSGILYAYVKRKKLYVCRYEDNECIQKTKVDYQFGITYNLQFMGDDKYLAFRNGDEMILYQIEA